MKVDGKLTAKQVKDAGGVMGNHGPAVRLHEKGE